MANNRLYLKGRNASGEVIEALLAKGWPSRGWEGWRNKWHELVGFFNDVNDLPGASGSQQTSIWLETESHGVVIGVGSFPPPEE